MRTLRNSLRENWSLIGKSLVAVVAAATVAGLAPLATGSTRVAGVSGRAAEAGPAGPTNADTAPGHMAPKNEAAVAPPQSAEANATTSSSAAPRSTRPSAAPRSAPAKSWEQQHGEKALARIKYPWRELGYKIVFKPAHRSYRGMTYGNERRIEIYVRRGDSVEQTAFDLGHEIGHAVDFTYLTDGQKSQWRRLRGYSGSKRTRGWYGCNRCDDFSTPAGDFAEVFAYWRVRNPKYFQSRMASLPSSRQLQQLDDLMQPPKKQTARPAPRKQPSGSQAGSQPSSGSGETRQAKPNTSSESRKTNGNSPSSGGQQQPQRDQNSSTDNRSVYRRTVDSLPVPSPTLS